MEANAPMANPDLSPQVTNPILSSSGLGARSIVLDLAKRSFSDLAASPRSAGRAYCVFFSIVYRIFLTHHTAWMVSFVGGTRPGNGNIAPFFSTENV